MNSSSRAFGLVRVLTIIFVAGLFGGLIAVGVILHRNAGLTARTRIQFIQYESALKAYCHEYGEMPPFIGQEEILYLNRDGNSELLIKALSGRNPDGSQLSQQDKDYLNPFAKKFYTFADSDFFRRKNGSLDRSQLADAFNNPNICIILESALDNDTTIPKALLPQIVQREIVGDLLNTQIVIFSVGTDSKTTVLNCAKNK
ncbi:MAG: hypothetical protein LBF42_00040 [Puniceicoccales bacterium]|jgi:hypothetical protein|nr:hypothetical protein [Puniceicoccales bacterium]